MKGDFNSGDPNESLGTETLISDAQTQVSDLENGPEFRFTLRRDLYEGVMQFGSQTVNQAVVIMLNPSTADDTADDPTMRRVIRFAKKYDATNLTVVNLLAQRATQPVDLAEEDWLRSRLQNLSTIRTEMATAVGINDTIIVAWGAATAPKGFWHRKAFKESINTVVETATKLGIPLWSLATTQSGMPGHPLYLSASSTLSVWHQPEGDCYG